MNDEGVIRLDAKLKKYISSILQYVTIVKLPCPTETEEKHSASLYNAVIS